MGLYESSVDLALGKGDLELAKINADRPDEDDVLRRKLWLKVAKFVVQEQKDIKRWQHIIFPSLQADGYSAMSFLESTDLLKIEDILPFFPDFVVIDDFKEEICSALEDYSLRIEELRAEMDEATLSAEAIKRDIQGLQNRFITVEPGDKCWKCGLTLVTKQFYVFPCQHMFHAECLITMVRRKSQLFEYVLTILSLQVKEYLPASALRRLLHLQTELVPRPADSTNRALLSSSFSPTPSRPETPRQGANSTVSTATDLLLGVTGRNKLLAAGDRLRDLIVPDVLAQAVSVVGAGVGVGSGDRRAKLSKKEKDRGESRGEAARKELDELVASTCPLCEGAVMGLDKPFVIEGEDVRDWEI
jgi:hypothetical protein